MKSHNFKRKYGIIEYIFGRAYINCYKLFTVMQAKVV